MDVKQNVNYLLKTTKNERINRKTVVVKSVFSLLIMIKVYHQTSYFMGWNTTIVGCEMSETCLSLNPVVLDISVNADIPWHCAVTVHYRKNLCERPSVWNEKGFFLFLIPILPPLLLFPFLGMVLLSDLLGRRYEMVILAVLRRFCCL